MTDTRPTVNMKDLDRAWYVEDDGWILKLRFRKDGESGTIQFGKFETKDEAQQFLVQLKQGVI